MGGKEGGKVGREREERWRRCLRKGSLEERDKERLITCYKRKRERGKERVKKAEKRRREIS